MWTLSQTCLAVGMLLSATTYAADQTCQPLAPLTTGMTRLSELESINVATIRVCGSSSIPASELAKVTAPYTGRRVTMDQLEQLRMELSKLYAVDKLYVTSGVIIPDQLDPGVNGVIELRAIEGGRPRIDVQGNRRMRSGYVEQRLQRRLSEPLNLTELKDTLLWLSGDENLRRVDARLLPGDVLGKSTLRLQVDEADLFEVGVIADNHGSSSIGAERGRVSLTVRNATGFGESFSATGALTEGANDAAGSLRIPLSAVNTQARFNYVRSDSKIIEREVRDLDIKSLTTTLGVEVEQPFESIRTANDAPPVSTTVTVGVGVQTKANRTSLLGESFSFSPGAEDGESKTTVGSVNASWARRAGGTLVSLRGAYRQGFDAVGATIFDPQNEVEARTNPTGADGKFGAFVGQGLYVVRLNELPWLSKLQDRGQLQLRSTFQIATDPLLSLEKFAVGGADSVRGYEENLLVRDNGLLATVELQLPIFGYRPDPHPWNLVLTPFLDYGRSWDEVDTDPTSRVRNTDTARWILGAGVGFLWEPLRGLQAQLYWGSDVADNFDGDDPRMNRSSPDLQAEGIHFLLAYRRGF